MADTPQDTVEIVAYNPLWPHLFANERELLVTNCHSQFIALEHIGSTAVHGLRAKPIIDMMAAVHDLSNGLTLVNSLNRLGYDAIETNMPNRVFLRKQDSFTRQVFHLHIVEYATWETRKERLMRDYLRMHPEVVNAYGTLKDKLATVYPHDLPAYTKAKTEFIQKVIDQARDSQGLPRINVWEDD